jgi:hypothetical protein
METTQDLWSISRLVRTSQSLSVLLSQFLTLVHLVCAQDEEAAEYKKMESEGSSSSEQPKQLDLDAMTLNYDPTLDPSMSLAMPLDSAPALVLFIPLPFRCLPVASN